MKDDKRKIDIVNILYYIFIIIIVISIVRNLFFADDYLIITAVATFGLVVTRMIRNK